MGDEERRVGGVNDHHAHFVVGCDLRAESSEFDDQLGVEQVDRWVVDRRPADSVPDGDPESLIVVVAHGKTLCDGVVTWLSSGIGRTWK